ncbi:glycosyltransferase family 1 protein [Bacteroidia bacterium]|nr:glycosyltransferase family 1 protein [Bacteroidia bacterium]
MTTLSNKRTLHIVAFDVPFPANYGGVIDIYYKIKAIYEEGIDIKLHVYNYGRKLSKSELSKYCSEINYYSRKIYKNPFMGTLPYIVNSRNSSDLLNNLQKDQAPILFEGLHCTYYLAHPSLQNRVKIVRTHNIEHHYYKHLESSESKYFKKYFFRIEAEKLKKHQEILKHANIIAAISPNDTSYFNKKFGNTIYIPAFHSNNKMVKPDNNGDFVLYHGNLSVPENYNAAKQLILNVFSKIKTRAIIAGNNPPKELITLCNMHQNVELKYNLSTDEIHQLIENAHINVLYTNQNTGIKLKLLNALYLGRFSIVNSLMVEGSGLEKLCSISNNFQNIIQNINTLTKTDYTENHYTDKKLFLEKNFNNTIGVQKLIKHIYK